MGTEPESQGDDCQGGVDESPAGEHRSRGDIEVLATVHLEVRVDDTAIPVGRALLEAVATAYGRLESQPIQDLRP